MKLIIDIDEQHFELLQMAVMNGMGDNAQKIIAQGIPFEQIRAEIQKVLDAERDFTSENARAQAIALSWCLEIIDKYK